MFEPDLAELLPAYYCLSRGRQQNHSAFKDYQLIYLPQHKETLTTKQDPPITYTQSKTEMTNKIFEMPQPNMLTNSNPIEEFKDQLNYLKEKLSSIHKWQSSMSAVVAKMRQEQDDKINTKIEDALQEYEADRIGLMDYAASYAGGIIAQISKETIPHPTHRPLSLFKIVNVDVLSSPEEILRPCVLPGSCFAFRGNQGAILIRLGKPIIVGGITLSHGSRFLLGTDGMSSAPKEFEVHGFADDYDDSPTFLGKFTYDWMGKQHQTFKINETINKKQLFELIELKILNNYGKEEFTCIYRFRVHKSELDESEKYSQAFIKKKRKCC